MSISPEEYRHEVDKLAEVCGKISEEIGRKEESMQAYKNEVVSIRKAMWENTAHTFNNEIESMIEATQYINAMKQEEDSYRFTKKLVLKYKRLLQTPYFARIDFEEEGTEETEQIYIGIHSFIENETMDVVVHDWRAPVSSMFYEYELGDASYNTRDGITHGEILLKRQFNIKDSKLKYVFDSSIKIDDEMLQELLSSNTSDKMKNIVTTIQKEQDRVIRHDKGELLVVQGAAGSGKTSIALHRIAYLLYKNSELNSGNITIFSPSQVFSDYVSNVLPELGEENVHQATFYEYASKQLDRYVRFESPNGKMEFLLGIKPGERADIKEKSIKLKTSGRFFEAFKRYIDLLGERSFDTANLSFGSKVAINPGELQELYNKGKDKLPMAKRLKIVRERALYLLSLAQDQRREELKKELENSNLSRKEIAAEIRAVMEKEFGNIRDNIHRFTNIDLIEALRSFYSSRVYAEAGLAEGFEREDLEEFRRYSLRQLENRYMDYDDAMLLLYLKCKVEGVTRKAAIKHVVIDEAQDYSTLQYEIINELFPESSFTILGDLNQSINPYGHIESYEELVRVMNRKAPEVLRLTKSYRSTRQIMDFTGCLLPLGERTAGLEREGELPKLVELGTSSGWSSRLCSDIGRLQEEGFGSIAVICKTAEICSMLYDNLKEACKLNLIIREEDMLRKGVTLIPSYLCKGLEFDAVLVFGADAEDFTTEAERRLLYTMCTRALHRLHVYYQGEPSPFLRIIGTKCYTHNRT